jgi:hypothetical protein
MAFSAAERATERREAKLVEIQQLIDAGSLTVRKMTPAERKLYPPPAQSPRCPVLAVVPVAGSHRTSEPLMRLPASMPRQGD